MMASGPALATYAGVVVTVVGVGLVVGFWGRKAPDVVRDEWEDDMTEFSQTIRKGSPYFSDLYKRERRKKSNLPEGWDKLFQEAEWPRWHPDSNWNRDCLSGVSLDALDFAESIVEHSSANSYRHDLKLIGRKWGERLSAERDWSKDFRRYVRDKIAGYHSKHIKLVMYCEIAAWEEERHPAGKPASEGLFRLAKLLRRSPIVG